MKWRNCQQFYAVFGFKETWKFEIMNLLTYLNKNFVPWRNACSFSKKFPDIFNIGITVAVSILRSKKNLCSHHETFCKKYFKQNRPGQYLIINTSLRKLDERWSVFNIDSNSPIIKEKVLAIKERHNLVSLMVSVPQVNRLTDGKTLAQLMNTELLMKLVIS